MKNSTRYLLSHLTTRLGIAALYSSMHLHPAGCEMPPADKRIPAACVSSIHLEAAQGFLSAKGIGGWRSAGKGGAAIHQIPPADLGNLGRRQGDGVFLL